MVQDTAVTIKSFSLHKPLCYLLSYSSCYFPYLHSSAKFTPLTSTPLAPLTSSSPIFHIYLFTSLSVSPHILSSLISSYHHSHFLSHVVCALHAPLHFLLTFTELPLFFLCQPPPLYPTSHALKPGLIFNHL